MNRREMVILPGIAALAATSGFAGAQPAVENSPAVRATISHKTMGRYSGLKSFYAIPKSPAKQAKYVQFLTMLLGLAPGQQSEAASIFAAAATSLRPLKASMKTVRLGLSQSVVNNDDAGIRRQAAAMGRLATQRHLVGAGATAAFYQILDSAQKAKLNQLKSLRSSLVES